jgi:hypothetical protein
MGQRDPVVEAEAGAAVDAGADGTAVAGAAEPGEAGGLADAGLAPTGAGLLRGCKVMCTRPPAAALPSISPVSVL